MFLHLSVILFTGGVCPMACWYTPHLDTRGRHPTGTRGRHTHTHPVQTPPPPRDTTGYGQQAGGMHLIAI